MLPKNEFSSETIELLRSYNDFDFGSDPAPLNPDELDTRINWLPMSMAPPWPSENELYGYEQTPVRLILQMIRHAAFSSVDVFWDIGSGMGTVTALVELLSDAKPKGVEINSELLECSMGLPLVRSQFVLGDARLIDLSDGTVFFLSTPLRGEASSTMLSRIHAIGHPLRIYGYGEINFELDRQAWLECILPEGPVWEFRLAGFKNRIGPL